MKQQRKKEKQEWKTKKQNTQNIPKQQQTPKNIKNGKPKGNQQLPTIQDMLEIPKENRAIKTFEYFKRVKPFLHSYIIKKQGSRAVQLMFKWGNSEIKSQIYKDILKNWKELIKSNYALHVISKVSVEFQFPKIVEDAIILQNNKEGSMVIEHFINNHPNSPKTIELFKKFQDIFKQGVTKGPQSQEVLHNLAMKSIQKEYYGNKISKLIIKLALPTMFEAEKQKTIQFFSERSLELFNDEQGVKLFVDLFNLFDSKQKKNIFIKQVKGHINDILAMSKISYIGLIKILTEVDDTVAIGNKLIPELLGDMNQLLNQNSKLYNVLISILSPRNNNFNCLGKIERTVTVTTCKKPQQTRKQQIRYFIYPYLIEYLTNSEIINSTCNNINLSRLSLGLIKSMQTDSSEQLKSFATTITKHFLANLEQAKIEGSKKIDVEKALVADPFGSKLIKNILFLQQTYIDKFCDKFSELFKNNLEKVLYSNASFVLTVLIEKGRNQLMEEIKRIKVDFNNVKAREFYEKRLKLKKN